MKHPVLAIDPGRRTNAELIADCYELGYLPADGLVLDATYGKGNWWKLSDVKRLVSMDLKPGKAMLRADFRAMPFRHKVFDAVAYDPPYKLNGTSITPSEAAYGVDIYATMESRLDLAQVGLIECVRVLKPGGHLLVKCQAQVAWGRVRWQDRIMADAAEGLGCTLVDRIDLLSYRPQPEGRRQVHARRNHSTLLVCRREG